jgi:hypothetical protein
MRMSSAAGILAHDARLHGAPCKPGDADGSGPRVGRLVGECWGHKEISEVEEGKVGGVSGHLGSKL